MNREEIIEFEKRVDQVSYDAEVIVYEAIGKMAEAGVTPSCAVSALALHAFNHLDQAPVETQLSLIQLISDKLGEHAARIEREGHDVSDHHLI